MDPNTHFNLGSTKKPIIITVVVLVLFFVCIFWYWHATGLKNDNSPGSPLTAAKLPEVSSLPADATNLGPLDKVAFDERSSWVPISVGNQPKLAVSQKFDLPQGWRAREDYLLTVLPQTMPANIRNYRSIIMRPQKTQSREDAIFTVPNTTDIYFKDHCHVTKQPAGVCYGGTNPETKHVFDLMFYFDK